MSTFDFYGWVDDEVADHPFPSKPMGLTHTEPMTLNVEFTCDPEVLELIYGKPKPAEHSVLIDTVSEVSAIPPVPRHIPGFRAWITRANAKAKRQHGADMHEWRMAGMPRTRKAVQRLYIPRAQVGWVER